MFDQFISFQARIRPTALAIVSSIRMVDFETFDACIDKVAVALGHMQVSPNEAVSVDVHIPYYSWLCILALARLGIASAPPEEANCRMRISERSGEKGDVETIEVSMAWFAEVLGRDNATPRRIKCARDNLARVICSSGTTGEAKRIGLTWQVVEAIIRNTPIAYGASHGGRWLSLPSSSTILGFALTLGAWATGNAAVFLGGSTLNADLIDRLQPSLIGMVPVQLQNLLVALPSSFRPRHPICIVTGGSALPASLARQAALSLTIDIRSVYGASECSAVAIADVVALERQQGAVGYVLPGVDVDVVDSDDQIQRAGTRGQVRIRSDRVVGAYLDDPERTTTMFRNGWFYTGDYGRVLNDGLLIIEGRVDDLMNLGGDKLAPHVIEDALRGGRGIRDVAAYALTDDFGFDRCWLSIVPDEDFERSVVDQHVASRLPWIDLIYWRTVDSVPRNVMGKIQRILIRDATRRFLETGGVGYASVRPGREATASD